MSAAHAANQALERRLVQNQVNSRRDVENVREELRQCHRREEANQLVFTQDYEREKNLATRERDLVRKEAELSPLLRAVEVKERELCEKEVQLLQKDSELLQKKDEFMQREEALDIKEQGLKDREQELNVKEDAITSERNSMSERASGEENERIARDLWLHEVGDENVFKVQNREQFTTYRLPISAAEMDDIDIQLLRRHDYYKGWYDYTTRAYLQKLSPRPGNHAYLSDIRYSEHPYNAGLNAGALFSFAALCKKHKPEWSIRLDDRELDLETLVPSIRDEGSEFWKGFIKYKNNLEQRFPELLRTSGRD